MRLGKTHYLWQSGMGQITACNRPLARWMVTSYAKQLVTCKNCLRVMSRVNEIGLVADKGENNVSF